ncbi:hypothetical protein ACERII_02340 [Evansella sp. AB-rgal1]|uniref:hypothetical protein n=1 Tax=Evansella sp. AB-rgal1 TaxID=3242696 RepID=UPI00359DB225
MKYVILSVLSIGILLLTGCLYPDEQRMKNRVPYADQIQSVQSAVNQFRQDQGVLPIKTREADTPIFRKYPIDFAKLVPRYLQSAPGNSFENGGTFQYVLVNPEELAEVKLIDITTIREIQELNRRITLYRREHRFAPIAELVGYELLRLDYEALNYSEEPTVNSPFHPNHRLPLLMQSNGEIVIDYSLDIKHYIEEYGMDGFEEGDDLRWLLVNNSPFVPVYSLPQIMNNEHEIVFTENK